MIQSVRGLTTFRAFHTAPLGRCGAVRARCLLQPSDPLPRAGVPTEHDGIAVAYALGRRVGSAVVRNRIRRRLRAVVADLDRGGNVLLSGASYLVMSGPEVADCPFPDLVTWVEGALREAGRRSVAHPTRRPGLSARRSVPVATTVR